MTTITATKRGAEGEKLDPVSVEYDMPDTLAGLTEKFGEAAVASAASQSFTISLQSIIRSNFEKSQEEVEAAVNAWQPGVRQAGVKKSPLEKAKAALSQMSAEDRAALLASLGG